MEFDFDDILKEFGVDSENEKIPEKQNAPLQENVALTEPEEEPAADFAEPDDLYEQTDSDSDYDYEEEPAGTDNPGSSEDDFRFEWPEPEPERTGPVKRNYDPEKYPDAIRAREREKAREERAAAALAAREKREAERAEREQARRSAEQARREKEQLRRAEEEARNAERRLQAEERTAAREAARIEKENEKTAERLARRQEKDAAKASREAKRRAELNARDAIREAKEQEKVRHRRESYRERRQNRIGLVVFLILMLLVASGVTYAGIAITRSTRNYPNIYVNDIAVGKLNREQTIEKLNAAGWETRSKTPLTVTTYGGVRVEVDPLLAGTVITAEEAADEAYAVGRSSNIFENLISYVESLLMRTDISSKPEDMNTSYVAEKATEVVQQFDASLGDTEYTVDIPGEQITGIKGQGSAKLNERDLYNSMILALENGQTELNFTSLLVEPRMPDFDALFAEIHVDPKEAYFSDDGRFTITPEIVGCTFDVEGAKAAWQAVAVGETFTCPMSVTVPAVTEASLQSTLFRDLLGAMTTKYTNSGENRCSNVRLCAQKINEYVMYPGDEFSYNQVVGARTEEAGFLPAPAYAGVGEDGVKDEIGGGACQVSSTLYCASIFAFLETVERTAHVYPVNYIQLGTDATVTIPEEGGNVMDMKFRNNKNYPIRIVAYTEETDELKTLTVEIWGTLEESDFMPIEFDNTASYTWDIIYDRVIQPAYPDREGYKIKFDTERYTFEDAMGAGRRTITHRKVYDTAGNLVLDEVLNPTISTGYAMDTYYNH